MFNPQTVSRLTRLWCGVVVLTSVGCQTYSPYGYGSYGSYPGTYGTPVYTQPGQPAYGSPSMAPVPMVPPGGGYPPAGGYPGQGMQSAPGFTPGTVTPSTPYPNVPNGPLPQQSGDTSGGLGQPGSFPGSTNAPVPHVPVGTNKAVPDYPDPDSIQRKPAATPNIDDDAAEGAERATQKLKREDDLINKSGALRGPSAEDIQFTAAPVHRRGSRNAPSEIIQTAQHVDAAPGTHELRPYGRAANGHAWFRGLIDFDEQENQWYLIYNPEPGIEDAQGGMITLVEHPHFRLLQRDNPVTLEGVFDQTQLDTEGRPKYRANIVRPLVP